MKALPALYALWNPDDLAAGRMTLLFTIPEAGTFGARVTDEFLLAAKPDEPFTQLRLWHILFRDAQPLPHTPPPRPFIAG